jgi:hypothetical protein
MHGAASTNQTDESRTTVSSTAINFMPTAAHIERSRIEPGDYRATCTAVKPPELYRAFARWFMRVDFAIHDDGAVVSKYINLGFGNEPNTRLGPRTDYRVFSAELRN